MAMKDAMLALKADNPNLTVTPKRWQLEGFSQALTPSVMADQTGTASSGAYGGSRENVSMIASAIASVYSSSTKWPPSK